MERSKETELAPSFSPARGLVRGRKHPWGNYLRFKTRDGRRWALSGGGMRRGQAAGVLRSGLSLGLPSPAEHPGANDVPPLPPQPSSLIRETGLADGPCLQEPRKGPTRDVYTSAWPAISSRQTPSMSPLLPSESRSEQRVRRETACVRIRTRFAGRECASCAMFVLFEILGLALMRLRTGDRAGVLESQGFAT